MTTKRTARKKKDLSRLAAWPGPAEPAAKHTARSLPKAVLRAPLRKALAHDLPALYHETYIRLIPRDPHLLFSFWETAGTVQVDGTALLRLYERESGGGEKIVGDFSVADAARSRYLGVPMPGRNYRLEFGSATQGVFVPLCSSNEVSTPSGRMPEPQNMAGNRERRAAAAALSDFSSRALPSAPYTADTKMLAVGL